ncbi:hypothetical protein MRB53_033268 [Persea americana]|uniref:Uncharacterized protein n=1 Tax=Persea americana TaxID=3435 RepID=A0ACC2KUE8_PERAE|nr:hypothetical protein MRB53_033268 [Persea americana]
MGMNVIPVKELTADEPKMLTLNLLKNMDPNDPQNEKSRGQLTMQLTYKPFKEDDLTEDATENGYVVETASANAPEGGGMLVVTVHEAQDVEGKHHTNPYVRVLFRGEERKTKHVKKNRDPRWEHEFEYMLEEPPLNDKMHIEVVSKPPRIGLHSKELLGYVDITLGDVVRNKRINEKYHLIDSKNGRLQVELQWRT